MKVNCGCHCIKCGSMILDTKRTGAVEDDGYFDMHHTCLKCKTHFDHLDGTIFDSCKMCEYKSK